MTSSPTTLRRLTQLLIVIAAMLVPLLTAETASASHDHYYYVKPMHNTGPCPNWSIDSVLADIDGDWDRDSVTNGDEVFHSNGLNPCVADSKQFCTRLPAYCNKHEAVKHPIHLPCRHGKWTWDQVNANPHGDWDGDGVSNLREAQHGARPCTAPCPTAYLIDVNLNPSGDWDGDGRTNQYEVDTGTNVCTYTHRPHVRVTPPPRLPHVGASNTHTHPGSAAHTHANGNVAHTHTNIAPKVTCPPGYPYLHETTGRCHANPILPH